MNPAALKVTAYCLECARRHPIEVDPLVQDAQFADWYAKHAGHYGVGFDWPGRTLKPSWVDALRALWRVFTHGRAASGRTRLAADPGPAWDFARPGPHALAALLPNGNVTTEYAASAALTITLASLATSSTLVAGQESTSVSNTTNKYLDYLLGGKITTGTSPTTNKSLNIFVIGSIDDTPTWPDVMDGTDSAETWTSVDIRNAGSVQFASTAVDSTSNRTYWFAPACISPSFGWVIPKNWGVWVSHDTGVNLNATGTNHALSYTGVYAAVA